MAFTQRGRRRSQSVTLVICGGTHRGHPVYGYRPSRYCDYSPPQLGSLIRYDHRKRLLQVIQRRPETARIHGRRLRVTSAVLLVRSN
ncbi:hypothetical protein DAEQUDRAFT_724765 [Daedalea quercina L-15889]|uniref:Uncharacterized protein n=1 Tax=Daedalea quercina L-15889 TaxID=1314783 RepID=A0A165RPL7_9APHY|nr:hypothetical protein DAEQUDRAFT_724765 [Daedalea quercina L-15889]